MMKLVVMRLRIIYRHLHPGMRLDFQTTPASTREPHPGEILMMTLVGRPRRLPKSELGDALEDGWRLPFLGMAFALSTGAKS